MLKVCTHDVGVILGHAASADDQPTHVYNGFICGLGERGSSKFCKHAIECSLREGSSQGIERRKVSEVY